MNTIKQQWDSFAKEVIPPNAGPTQIEECRRAFYSGAGAMFGLMTGPTADQSEDAACAMLDGFLAEIGLFAEELTK